MATVDEIIHDKGVIFLSGEIDDIKAENVCKQIVAMNSTEKLKKIELIINSGGGYISPGFSIINMIEWSRIPVYTIGLGNTSSAALMILMTGKIRTITARTSICSHRHSWQLKGSHAQILAENEENEMLFDKVVKHYIKYSKIKTEKELKKTLLKEVDIYLTPNQALKYGLVDKIMY